ncbi:MAG: hypothetical protein DI598_04080 [Pseudopedobacter saltans]|uniref:Type VI secretion system contractile sheath small subunit n=1 Tax=Pseudopedobacter saltans TaxID=151895 RepID=A0A2W5GZ49_9SPHI|nr:MAG: hypothetical protein DI598_04080 [Pseudopedobacter saltans]
MALEPYGIGGTEVKTDANEAFVEISQNRVLLAERLTVNPSVKPVIVEGLTDIEKVFAHFKPSLDIAMESEDGGTKKETLHFNGLEDFGAKGITHQSEYLSDLNQKKEQYLKIVKQLKTNKLLKQAISDPSTKQNLISALQSLLDELAQAEK